MSTQVKAIPEGYQAVIPYLVVEHAEAVIEFIKQAFGAQELCRMVNPGGQVGHTELRIRDSVVMLGGASEQWKAMPTMLYLYVDNVDEVYQRALAAGGTSMKEPADQFYGDRTAAVVDQSGNQWWLATHVEEVSPEEMERRHKAARG
jgi:PhnB protein